jgi:acetoin utilization protein AcuB
MKKEPLGKRVSEYMDSRPPVVSSLTSVNEALRLVRGHGFPALPVCDKGRFLGLVREKDLLKMTPSQATLLSRHELPSLLENVTVGALVTSPPATVARDQSLREAAEIMVKHSSEVLPVLENDRYAGIISWVELLEAAMETEGLPA